MWRRRAKQASCGGDYAPCPLASLRVAHLDSCMRLTLALCLVSVCVSVQLNFKKMQCLLWALYCLMDMHHDLLPVQEPKGVLPIAGTPHTGPFVQGEAI